MNKISEIIKCLLEDARMPVEKIAERASLSPAEVEQNIKDLEKKGIIKGYQAIICSTSGEDEMVSAIIEVKVRPEREGGFDRIAKRISRFPEVVSLNLVSGSYDLELEVRGDTLQDVANFVASKLAPIDGVLSTNTCFLLKRYKIAGKILDDGDEYERLKVSP